MIDKKAKKAKYVAGLPAYNVAILLLLVVGLSTIGYFILKSHAAEVVKPPLQGLIDRQGYPANADYRSSLAGFVVNVDWGELQPNGTTDLNTTKIDNAINQAKSAGLTLKIRLMAGSQSPNWAKNLGGSPVTYYESVDQNAISVTIPHFWTAEYKQAYDQLQTKLAARYDGIDEVREITIGRCMTVYAEPMMRGIADPRNAANLLAAGYSVSQDENCQREEIDAHKVWSRTHSSLAANPYQVIKAGANGQPVVSTDVNYSLQLMDYCRASLGERCTLGNDSIGADVKSGYQKIYDAIKQRGPAITYQTETPAKMGDLSATLNWAIGQGANAVELNSNYTQDLPADKLKTFNQQLMANPTATTTTTTPTSSPTITPSISPSVTPTASSTPSTIPSTSPTPSDISITKVAPANLKVVAGSSNALAAWTPPAGQTGLLSYQLSINGKTYTTAMPLYNVVGLKPSTGYELTVIARNQSGQSSLPVTAKFTTDCNRFLWWCW